MLELRAWLGMYSTRMVHMKIGERRNGSLVIGQRKALIEKINGRIKRIFKHDDFDNASCLKKIIGPMPGLELYLEKTRQVRSQSSQSMPDFLRACYDQPLLTREQEQHLFRRYNFHKHRAAVRLEQNQIMAACAELKLADVCRKHLTSANVRLAIPLIRKYRKNRNYEDLVSESYYLICRAVDYFDWTRGFKFSTYATWSIVRTLGRTAAEMIQHDARYQQTTEECDVDPAASDEEQEERLRNDHHTSLVERLLNYCRPRERDVLKLRFMQGETLLSIASQMKISKERVRQIEKTGLERIASKAKEMGLTPEKIW
jgi:RNA polymerase primary sigma factor/RNA polymerase sigma factor